MKDGSFHKLPVGGIKLSLELIQIQLPSHPAIPVHRVFSCLADLRINMTLVVLDTVGGCFSGACCVPAEDRRKVDAALAPMAGNYRILAPVGALTVFPHQSRLELVGRTLAAMREAGAPVYGMASSFSAITVTTDYLRMDDIVAAILRVVELPENHAPFRPEFRVKQL